MGLTGYYHANLLDAGIGLELNLIPEASDRLRWLIMPTYVNSAIDLSTNPLRRIAVSREIKHVVRVLSSTKATAVFGGAPHSLTRRALEAAGLVVTVLGNSWRVG